MTCSLQRNITTTSKRTRMLDPGATIQKLVNA
jgi:hypothetical protein